MNPSEHILNLISEAFQDLGPDRLPLSEIIRKCIRIARLRNDYLNLWWLELEMTSLHRLEGVKDQVSRLGQEIRPHFTKEEYVCHGERLLKAWASEREIPCFTDDLEILRSESIIKGTSIDEIEAELAFCRQVSAELPDAKDMPLYRVHILQVQKSTYEAVLGRVRHRVHDFLSQTEKQLAFGQLHADIFERNRLFVDLKLGELCPDALAKFVSAYRRMQESDPESWAQALTSCRRLLKSLADALYPPTDEPDEPVVGLDDKARVLSDDKYVARLWQYVYERMARSTSGELLLSLVHDLGNRIDRLYELACKGVHADVSEFEVNQCVIQTYLLAGDLLRVAEGQSITEIEAEREDST